MNIKNYTTLVTTFLLACTSASTYAAGKDVTFAVGKTNVVITQGNLLKQNVVAIVNAANSNLQHGGGIAAAISDAAGPELQKQCDEKKLHCPVGNACATGAFKLDEKGIQHIIHAVGPDCRISKQNENKETLLHNAYQNSLRCAQQLKARTVAFPAISTAIFGYNVEQATPIAIKAVIDFVKKHNEDFDEIRFVIWEKNPKNFTIYQQRLLEYTTQGEFKKDGKKDIPSLIFSARLLIPTFIIGALCYIAWKYRKKIKKKISSLLSHQKRQNRVGA